MKAVIVSAKRRGRVRISKHLTYEYIPLTKSEAKRFAPETTNPSWRIAIRMNDKRRFNMKKIILSEADSDTIEFSKIKQSDPIFAKKNGSLAGMVVREQGSGWITKIGGGAGVSGHHDGLKDCLRRGQELGYEFFVSSFVV